MNLIRHHFKMILLAIPFLPFSTAAQDSLLLDNTDHLSMLLDFQSDSSLQVTATYAIGQVKSGEQFFLLNPGYSVQQITAEGLKGYELAMKANRPFPFYQLHFDTTVLDKQELKVHFEYSIDLKTTNHMRSNWIELNIDQLWFPHYDDLDREFTWSVTIENLYADYSVVSYEFNEIIRYRAFLQPPPSLVLEQAVPTPEVYLMMAPHMQLWENGRTEADPDIRFFVRDSFSDEVLLSMDEKLKNLIPFFHDRFGESKKIDRYLVILRNTDKISFLQSRGEILLGNADSDSYAALAHEVAHYWWSQADFIHEPWMNESFANYSMFLALEEFDRPSLDKQLERSRKNAANAGSVKTAGTFPVSNMNTYYHKGSILLWELEQQIGRAALLRLLRQRVEKNINSTAGFLDLLEEQEGREVREGFEARM